MSNLVYFRQGDPSWGPKLLGYNVDLKWNMANYGCLVTSLAMFVATVTGDQSWTPGRMNKFLQDNGAFAPGGGLLYWSAITRLFPFIEAHGSTNNVAGLNAWLQAAPHYALVKVNDGAHYTFAPLVGKMIDPIDAKLKVIPSTYKFTEARLFRFVGGKGSGAPAPAPATISTSISGEGPMTDEQEQQAYGIVLGRSREGAATGRTAMRFILDAQNEITQARANQQLQVRQLTDEASNLKAQLSSAQEIIEELQRQAKSYEDRNVVLQAQLTEATAQEWQKTYRADKRRLVADDDADIIDLAGIQPAYPLRKGMIVRQAGTFIKDGVPYARSQNSVDAGNWYGYPLDLFDLTLSDPSPDLNDRLQAKTAEAYGVVERIKELVKRIFSKKESK